MLRRQARVREHANLVRDVAPIMLGPQILEVLLQQRAHGDDAVCHALDLAQPLLVQLRVVQDLGRDARTVDGRVRVQRSDKNLDLRVHTLGLFLICADDGEGTHALAIKTHVLRKRLRETHVVPLGHKVPQRKRILVGITARKPLVRHVKEGEVLSRLHSLGDLPPLLLRRVHTRGIMRARMQQEDAPLGRALDVSHHAVEVKPDRVLVVVPVFLDREPGVLEHRGVVGPGRGRDVDLLRARVPALQERTADSERARAGDRLRDHQAVEGARVLAIREDRGGLGELGHARDAGVFFVQVGGDDGLLGGFDGWEDVRLSLVVAVGAHAEVDLLREGVGLESLGDAENGLSTVALVMESFSCASRALWTWL